MQASMQRLCHEAAFSLHRICIPNALIRLRGHGNFCLSLSSCAGSTITGSKPTGSTKCPADANNFNAIEEAPSIDAASSFRKPVSLWPGMYHSPVTNALWQARSTIFENLSDPCADCPPQSKLLSRTPSESRTSILYSFSSDYTLREQYRNPWNEVRLGKLLEDLDALAGTIAMKHCSDNDKTTRPLLLVTASVDKMALKKPIRVDTDLKVSGAVTWVGRSSLEIQMRVTQPPAGYAFAGHTPRFLEVDHVDFLRPVDVGNFLRFKSDVLYTQLDNPNQPVISIEVIAHVTRPELRSSEVSNNFYFKFTVHSDALEGGLKLRRVLPATEEEARRIVGCYVAENLN